MEIISFSKMHDGLELQTSSGRLRVVVISEKIIRVQYTLADQFSSQPSVMVLPQSQVETSWEVAEEENRIILKTQSICLKIDRQTGAFTWVDGAGNLLVREPEREGKVLREIPLADHEAYSTKLSLVFAEGEAVYGLGQHEEGVYNYRGHSEYLYHHNLKVAMPVLVSSRGYAFFFDSCSLGNFHDDQYGTYYWSEVEDEMDFYFIYGPEFDKIISGIRQLSGKPSLLPKWAYGYIQSKERYKSQEELISTVNEFRERKIPLDCIVLDWLSWPGDLWGQKSFDAQRFPDPTEMMQTLHALNAHMMISIWPKVRNNGPNHVELREGGFLLGDDVTYNAFDPQARAVYWWQANEGLFQHGIDAWWCDSTEPFEPDWSGKIKPEPWQRMVQNTDVFRKFIDPAKINAYSLLHSQGMYEGQRAQTNAKRVVNLTRSGYPGQQRFGTITWSGDVTARWETLRKQIPAGLNFVVTGSPRWTFDIGGFFVNHNGIQWFWDGAYPQGCEDMAYRELFVRWFQMGAFLPIFRAHGTDTPREVWRFGQPGDLMYDTLVKFIELRYRLMPYIYSLAGLETHHDYSMMRSLVFDFRSDPGVYDVSDQFMLGPALMVCPVTEPMYYEAGSIKITSKPRQRSVYLPAGCEWYDFWTGMRYNGGQSITVDAPLEIIPLFIRSGSILPLGPVIQYADEKMDAPLELRIYPGADGSFALYDDAGNGYGYEKGEYSWTHLTWDNSFRRLTICPRSGSYDGMPTSRIYKAVLTDFGDQSTVEREVTGESQEIIQY